MSWSSAGIVPNGVALDLLADTGALTLGTLTFMVFVWTDTQIILDIVLRNATNLADLNSQRFTIDASASINALTFPVAVLLNQRVIARLVSGFSGLAQVSILT